MEVKFYSLKRVGQVTLGWKLGRGRGMKKGQKTTVLDSCFNYTNLISDRLILQMMFKLKREKVSAIKLKKNYKFNFS